MADENGATALAADAVPDPTGTPQEQPAGSAPVAAPNTQTVNVSELQAAFTRVSQENAAYRRELGLDKGATQQDILGAISTLKTRQSLEAQAGTDPQVAAALARAERLERQQLANIYGTDLMTDVDAILDEARTSGDLTVIAARLHSAIQRQAPAAAPPVTEQAAAQVPTGIPMDTPGRARTVEITDAEIDQMRDSGKGPQAFMEKLLGTVGLPSRR